MVANPDLLTKPYQVLHHAACAGGDVRDGMSHQEHCRAVRPEEIAQSELFRDIFGNPFRPVSFDTVWRTSTAVALAKQMYDSRDFSAMPILADALQEAGCDNEDLLNHCRVPGAHFRGCWVVDLVLERE
jgi:hypothetical protein